MSTGIILGVGFIFGLLCLVGRIILMALSIMYKSSFNVLSDKLPSDYTCLYSILISCIVICSFYFAIFCCECCCDGKENICMMLISSIFFIAQVSIGISALVAIKDKTDLESKVEVRFSEIFNNYDFNAKAVNAIQEKFNCCGLQGPINDGTNATTPDSCYANKNDMNTLYTDGCLDKITTLLEKSMENIGIILITLSAVEIFSAILAYCLAKIAVKRMQKNQRLVVYSV